MAHGDFSFADFYWRRVRRLFPALVLILATTLALGWLLLLPDEFKQLGKHASAAAAFLANFALWRESGYFDTAAELKPLLHLWSLGIEEQFYLVWPAVLVALWKRRAALLLILSTLVIASFALSVNSAHAVPVANFYSPASRFWELGAGCLLALLTERRISRYDRNEKECEQVWRTFVRYVHQAKPKVVIVVGNGSFLITDPRIQLIRQGATVPESKEAVFEYGIRSLLSELAQFSRVIHLGEIPAFSTAPSCFLRAVRLPTTKCHPERDRDQVELAMAPYNRVLNRVQKTLPEVQLVDAIAVLCAADVCSQRPPGKPILYSDAVHLSPAGARLLVEHTGLPDLISRDISIADSG